MVVERGDDFESPALVVGRSLEREGHQDDLLAAAPAGLLLGRPIQLRSQAKAAPRLLDPELADLAGTTPGVAADPGDDAAGIVPQEEREPFAVRDARGRRVVLVDAVLQVLHFIGRRLDRQKLGVAHWSPPDV